MMYKISGLIAILLIAFCMAFTIATSIREGKGILATVIFIVLTALVIVGVSIEKGLLF